MEEKSKMLLYNDALTTVCNLISAIDQGMNRKTGIMYYLKTNHKRMNSFIDLAVEHQLITEHKEGDRYFYKVTDKGKRYAELIKGARGMLSYE